MATVANTRVRRAILAHLCGRAGLVALVPKERIYPPQVPPMPAWPFVQYGAFADVPRRASCLDGQTLIGAIHGFAKGPGEDAVEAIGAEIAAALDGTRLDLESGGYIRTRYTGGQTLRDNADTNSWHRVTNLQVQVYA